MKRSQPRTPITQHLKIVKSEKAVLTVELTTLNKKSEAKEKDITRIQNELLVAEGGMSRGCRSGRTVTSETYEDLSLVLTKSRCSSRTRASVSGQDQLLLVTCSSISLHMSQSNEDFCRDAGRDADRGQVGGSVAHGERRDQG